jgi:hypothetical protein
MNMNQGSYYKKIVKRGVVLFTVCALLVPNVPMTVRAEGSADVASSTGTASSTEVDGVQTDELGDRIITETDMQDTTEADGQVTQEVTTDSEGGDVSTTEESESVEGTEENNTEVVMDESGDTQMQIGGEAVNDASSEILDANENVFSNVNSETAGDVAINETNFPDAIFRDYITKTFDRNSDQVLSEYEISLATGIYASSFGIESLQGVEFFENLQTLWVSGNKFKSVDISHNKKLSSFRCDSNNLTELDLSQNTELELLSLNNNNLTNLDISNNLKLVYLIFPNNVIEQLDISHLSNLKELDCGYNKFTDVNVSKNEKLEWLNINGNEISTINLKNNTNLTFLACAYTNIISLDLSNNNSMKQLICAYTKVGSIVWGNMSNYTSMNVTNSLVGNIDIGQCSALGVLYCSNNNMTRLDITKNTKLKILECDGNNLTELDTRYNTMLNYLDCSNNHISKLELPNQKQLYDLYCDSNNLVALDLSNADVRRGNYQANRRELSADKDGYVDLSILESDGFDINKASNWSNVSEVNTAAKKIKVDFSKSTTRPKQVEVMYRYNTNNTYLAADQEFILTITQYRTNIANAVIEMDKSQNYWGLELYGIRRITYNGEQLIQGGDYTVDGGGTNINTGTATITINGENDFTGSVTKTFQILPAQLSRTTIDSIGDQTYTGGPITPDVSLKLKYADYMVKDRDYTLSYANNTAAGTATVTITGKGNYIGVATTSFKINPIDITTGRIDDIPEQSYTCSEIKPETNVVVNNTTLINGTDYDLRFSNNINPGTATVTIIGKGNYVGEFTKNFKIDSNDIAVGKIEDISNQAYTGSEVKPDINVVVNNTTLVNGTDYDLSYSNNVNIGTATVTATGKGKYTGSISKTYNIAIAHVGNLRNEKSKTTSIKLKWDKANGVDGYEIYSCKTGSKKYTKLTTIKKVSTTTYTNKKLKIGTAYSYKIRAYKTVNGKKQYGEYTVLNTTTSMSKPVVKLSAGSKKATISYEKVSGANGYEIYMSTSKKGTYENVKTLTKASKIKYTQTGLTKKKTYYFKVRAYKNVNGEKVYSSYSTVKKIKVK